jgi:hypothetical protein
MATKIRKNQIMRKTLVGTGIAAIHTWADVANVEPPVVFDVSKCPSVTIDNLIDHGSNAKIGDGGALQDATTKEKMDNMRRIVQTLYNGEWAGERESGDTILLDAICEYNPKTSRATHATALKKLSTAERLKLRTAVPQIKTIYDRMIAESVAKSGTKDVDLLAGFSAVEENDEEETEE